MRNPTKHNEITTTRNDETTPNNDKQPHKKVMAFHSLWPSETGECTKYPWVEGVVSKASTTLTQLDERHLRQSLVRHLLSHGKKGGGERSK